MCVKSRAPRPERTRKRASSAQRGVGVRPGLVSYGGDLSGRVYDLAHHGGALDDPGVVLDVYRSGHHLDEVGEVGWAADPLEPLVQRQLVGDRHLVDRLAPVEQGKAGLVAPAVLLAVEVARLEERGDPRQGLAVDEDRSDERLFCVYVVRRQAFSVQLSILQELERDPSAQAVPRTVESPRPPPFPIRVPRSKLKDGGLSAHSLAGRHGCILSNDMGITYYPYSLSVSSRRRPRLGALWGGVVRADTLGLCIPRVHRCCRRYPAVYPHSHAALRPQPSRAYRSAPCLRLDLHEPGPTAGG